ncbi:MAG: hypothetical protein ACUVTD_08565 [Nitrososphaerales archaeon]
MTINGNNFASGWYRVYFDTNGNGAWNWGEPFKTVFVGAPGTFTTTLTIPSVPSGTYHIRADVYPYTAPAIASAPFTVKTIWEKLLDIQNDISDIKAKLDDATRWVSDADLSSAVSMITSAISSAQTAIIAEIDAIELKLDLLVVDADLDGVPDFIEEIFAIEAKLDSWFGTGGKFSNTAQATSGSGTNTFTASGSTTIYTGTKVGTVTVSISTTGIGYYESVRIRYYIDPANPTLYIQKTVTTNTNTLGWTDTAAAWKVEIDITGTGTVNYAFSVIYPP